MLASDAGLSLVDRLAERELRLVSEVVLRVKLDGLEDGLLGDFAEDAEDLQARADEVVLIVDLLDLGLGLGESVLD